MHSNTTTHYSLPIFAGTDTPAWQTDFNGAMTIVDSTLYNNEGIAQGAANDAATAIGDASAAVTTANAARTAAGNWIAAFNIAVADWVQSGATWVYELTNTNVTSSSLIDVYFGDSSIAYIETEGNITVTASANKLVFTADFEPAQIIVVDGYRYVNL